jgi:hypothetical protein
VTLLLLVCSGEGALLHAVTLGSRFPPCCSLLSTGSLVHVEKPTPFTWEKMHSWRGMIPWLCHLSENIYPDACLPVTEPSSSLSLSMSKPQAECGSGKKKASLYCLIYSMTCQPALPCCWEISSWYLPKPELTEKANPHIPMLCICHAHSSEGAVSMLLLLWHCLSSSVQSIQFLYCGFFQLKSNLWEDTLRSCQYPAHQNSTPVFGFYWFLLASIFTMQVTKWFSHSSTRCFPIALSFCCKLALSPLPSYWSLLLEMDSWVWKIVLRSTLDLGPGACPAIYLSWFPWFICFLWRQEEKEEDSCNATKRRRPK